MVLGFSLHFSECLGTTNDPVPLSLALVLAICGNKELLAYFRSVISLKKVRTSIFGLIVSLTEIDLAMFEVKFCFFCAIDCSRDALGLGAPSARRHPSPLRPLLCGAFAT